MNRRALVVMLGLLAVFSFDLEAAPVTYHVAKTGSNLNPGTALEPFATVQRAVSAAAPGDTILVHSGVYTQRIDIKTSGAPGRPIILRPAGDGPVTLKANLSPLPCSSTTPTRDRTIQILAGADHWRISNFTIVGGILVSGTNAAELTPYLQDRSLPGRGLYDPAEATTTLEALGSDGADYIHIVRNRIIGRGIHAVAARYGRIVDNKIFNIACGTGPGILLSRFSDGWFVAGNHVHHIAASDKHWMSEGIRSSSASMYGLIQNNLVEDIADPGRGITTDMNAGWNVIRSNVVRRTFTGLSEQEGGWGNKWTFNVSEANFKFGMNVLGMDADSSRPTDRTPTYLVVRCNQVVKNPIDLHIGTARVSRFDSNAVGLVQLGNNVRRYWSAQDNLWNGKSLPPPENPPRRDCA